MTAIELYYSSIPDPTGPYCAEDDPSLEDDYEPTEIEANAAWEYFMLSAGINPASFEDSYFDF